MTESRIKSIIAAGLSFVALSLPGVADAITAAGGDQAILAAFSACWVVAHGLIDYAHGKASGGGGTPTGALLLALVLTGPVYAQTVPASEVVTPVEARSEDPQHWAPVNETRYAGIIGRLRAQPLRADWSAAARTLLADDIDGLALSADDPGPQSIVMAVDQLRRIANGLRARRSFSPPQLANALASYVQQPSDRAPPTKVVVDRPDPDALPPLESFRAAAGSGVTPNQSYLMKNMQTVLSACHSSWIHDVAGSTVAIPGAWDHPFTILWYPTGWRTTSQKFGYREPTNGRGPFSTIEYLNARFDPGSGTVSYGPKKIAQNAVVDNDALTKVIRNDSDAVVSVSYDESASLTNSFSTNITKGLEINATASSTTTVEGEYAGVKASEAITLELGVTTTSEESTEEGEEGTTEEAISIEFEAAPGQYYLVTISKEHEVSYQDFEIDAVMDFDMKFYLQRDARHNPRLGQHYPGYDFTLTGGVAAFEQFINGLDTAHPQMQGFMSQAYSRTKNGVNCVLDPGKRRIQVSGTNQASLESNADYRVESLGSSLPPDLGHLPVEDAGDVGQ